MSVKTFVNHPAYPVYLEILEWFKVNQIIWGETFFQGDSIMVHLTGLKSNNIGLKIENNQFGLKVLTLYFGGSEFFTSHDIRKTVETIMFELRQ